LALAIHSQPADVEFEWYKGHHYKRMHAADVNGSSNTAGKIVATAIAEG